MALIKILDITQGRQKTKKGDNCALSARI